MEVACVHEGAAMACNVQGEREKGNKKKELILLNGPKVLRAVLGRPSGLAVVACCEPCRSGVLGWGQMEVVRVHKGAAMACNVQVEREKRKRKKKPLCIGPKPGSSSATSSILRSRGGGHCPPLVHASHLHLSPPQRVATANPPRRPNTARKTFGPMPIRPCPNTPPTHRTTPTRHATPRDPPCPFNVTRNAPATTDPHATPTWRATPLSPADSPPRQHPATADPPCRPNVARKTPPTRHGTPTPTTDPHATPTWRATPRHPPTHRHANTPPPPTHHVAPTWRARPRQPVMARRRARPCRLATPLQRDTQRLSNHRPPRHPDMARNTPPPADSPPRQHPVTADPPRRPNAARKTPPTRHGMPTRKTLPTRLALATTDPHATPTWRATPRHLPTHRLADPARAKTLP
ncbi:hypothetical protein EDB89DRAFT_2250834 [Lactarius sanguifluus]|nr:hypothetical protein EDB89DRAFT_2250834 [Lactarius sanguifluus]